MAADFKTYSFKNVNFIFGVIEAEGYAEGDDVATVIMNADQWNDLSGAKGDVVRTQTNDNRGTFTIKLLQTSKTNALFMALYNADRELQTGVLPAVLQDKELDETFFANNAWILKAPDIVRGQNPATMLWTFRADFITHVIA